MDLSLRLDQHGGVPVLALDGEVDLATLPRLRDGLVRATASTTSSVIVVDLDGVASFDDTGLGVLLGVAGRLRAQGGELLVVCSAARLLELLTLTRFDRAVEIHPTSSAAIAAARARTSGP